MLYPAELWALNEAGVYEARACESSFVHNNRGRVLRRLWACRFGVFAGDGGTSARFRTGQKTKKNTRLPAHQHRASLSVWVAHGVKTPMIK